MSSPSPPSRLSCALAPATLAGLAAILLWGALALLATATRALPPFQVTALSFLIGGSVALAIVWARGRLSALRQPPAAWTLGVAGLFGYHALYFAALKLAPPAEANLVNYLWPLFILLFTGLLPGMTLRPRQVAGALLGFAGVAVLAAGRGLAGFEPAHIPGYLLALGCAVTWAAYSVLLRRMPTVPTEAVAGFCLAAAALSGLAHLATERWVVPDHGAWLALAALGLGPVGAAFFLWDMGMKRGDIQWLGVASYGAPVLSTLLLVAAGAAPFTVGLVLACALIVAGAVVAGR